MAGDYYCAFCESQFHDEAAGDEPPCPTCGQIDSVKLVDNLALVSDIRRQWFAVFAVLFAATAAIVFYQWFGASP